MNVLRYDAMDLELLRRTSEYDGPIENDNDNTGNHQ